jgi:hypothetical protein
VAEGVEDKVSGGSQDRESSGKTSFFREKLKFSKLFLN